MHMQPIYRTMYHAVADCASVKKKFLPLTQFTYGELDSAPYSKLTICPYCMPTPRKAELEAVNEEHRDSSPGEVMSYHHK